MITVLLVDDHTAFRNGLMYLIDATEEIRVVAMASNGIEAVTEARRCCPDVTVMDISMPLMDGIEAARQIKESCQHTRVMMLSIYANPEYIQRALEVGALGFVLKDEIGKDLLAAIRALFMGERYFSQRVTRMAEHYMNRKSNGLSTG